MSGDSVANASAGPATRGVFVVAGYPLEFGFLLSTRHIARGHIRFHVRDVGRLPHRFKVCSFPTGRTSANDCVGRQTRVIAPGRSATLVVLFSHKGRYEFVCGVRGHAAAGMKGIIVVR
jgi:plastocyanin